MASNRTIVELKRRGGVITAGVNYPSNRTIVELKLCEDGGMGRR